MTGEIIDPLAKDLRALRALQCPNHIQPNAEGTAYRVSSGAFMPGHDATISVDLEESLLIAGQFVTARFGALDRSVALVGHKIAEYQDNGYHVAHTPIPENKHHGSAITALKGNSLRKAARNLAKEVEFLIPIDVAKAVALGAKPLSAQDT